MASTIADAHDVVIACDAASVAHIPEFPQCLPFPVRKWKNFFPDSVFFPQKF
jgi:hypothetical protein